MSESEDLSKLTPEQQQAVIGEFPWHHDFEVVPGVRTNGNYDPSHLWDLLQLPEDLTGKTMADIGASNGYFSFRAASQGASVTAFDFRHEKASGFNILKRINGYHVPHHPVNIYDLKPAVHGKHAIVLFLGVIYHLADPIRGLFNAIRVTKEKIFIESHGLDTAVKCPDGTLSSLAKIDPRLQGAALVQYVPDFRRQPELGLNGDISNFWSFSTSALCMIVEDLGCTVNRVHFQNDRVFIEAAPRQGDDFAAEREEQAYGLLGNEDMTPQAM